MPAGGRPNSPLSLRCSWATVSGEEGERKKPSESGKKEEKQPESSQSPLCPVLYPLGPRVPFPRPKTSLSRLSEGRGVGTLASHYIPPSRQSCKHHSLLSLQAPQKPTAPGRQGPGSHKGFKGKRRCKQRFHGGQSVGSCQFHPNLPGEVTAGSSPSVAR